MMSSLNWGRDKSQAWLEIVMWLQCPRPFRASLPTVVQHTINSLGYVFWQYWANLPNTTKEIHGPGSLLPENAGLVARRVLGVS